jgi:hypothetical protein
MADDEEDHKHLASDVLTMIRIRLGTLTARLRFAKCLYEAYEEAEAHREAAMLSLTAVIDFLASVDDCHREQLGKPLLTLFVALDAVHKGKRSPLLEPAKQGGRPSDTDFEAGYKAWAAAAMTLLMDTGLRQKEAARKVAKEMSRHGYRLPGGKAPSATTVRAWRDQVIGHHGGTVMGKRYDAMLKIARDHGWTDIAAALRLARGAGLGERGLVSGPFPLNPKKPPS